MKKTTLLLGLLILVFCLLGCVSVSSFSKIERGMTKAQVTSIVGQPSSTGFQNGNEIFYYNNVYDYGIGGGNVSYIVEFNEGRVVSYGQNGNVNRTQYVYNVNQKYY